MRFRRGTCGLCKPTKRYKTNATRKSQKVKIKLQEEIPNRLIPSVSLREMNK